MNLRIPGPIPVPDDFLQILSRQMINHRGPEFKELLYRVTERLKTVFATENDMFILSSSGTGGMEAAISNTLSVGDKVICASIGSFGNRFGEIAKRFGANVEMVNFEPGTSINIEVLEQALNDHKNVKAVLVTHNETNTGVTNNLKQVAKIVKKDSGRLLLVDGISSVCSIPLQTDEWECDVVVSASQKGWMLPPGLAFISFSPLAWKFNSVSDMPRFYFDLIQYKSYYEKGQPPWTPALSIIFALDKALEQIIDEGMENVYSRHSSIANQVRNGIKAIGLSLFPNISVASNTVTAVKSPDGLDADILRKQVQQDHDVVLAGGYGPQQGKIFRIGHLGYVKPKEIDETIDAINLTLKKV